jgi:propanol-preferring alcohol dehydrogenase
MAGEALMDTMLLERTGQKLARRKIARPEPGPGELLVAVHACGVCRTDLHVYDGELPHPKLPLVLGHEIVGTVAARGAGATRFALGARVGIPWLGWTCGSCRFCRSQRENLCERAGFTGYTRDGGYAAFTLADERYCFAIPPAFADADAAPLLCAGLIGYRSLTKAGAAARLGLYGFGAAAHIVAQLALHRGSEVFAFTRPGDTRGQDFAKKIGAAWVGGSDQAPPAALDAAIIFAPVGALVPAALRAVAPGGRVVCAGIHMSDIPSFPYEILWREREIVSVANLTRADGEGFFAAAEAAKIAPVVETLPLAAADAALARLRRGEIEGAFVLAPEH